MGTVSFKVDAALLRELGERLVGRPHVALAELIKNAYDADATLVELRIQPDRIEVSDNGHGMDLNAFKKFWMRIGSPHKLKQQESPGGRSLIGQKGVGRLAVQFLGRGLELLTKSTEDSNALRTVINWDEAVRERDLTSVTVEYHRIGGDGHFPDDAKHGTKLTITRLPQSWTEAELKDLALEIWALQPPFETSENKTDFRVRIVDAPEDVREAFEVYIKAFRVLWHARIVGKLTSPRFPGGKARCKLVVCFEDGTIDTYTREIEHCPLRKFDIDISIYSLTGRQPHGVKVGDLRKYLRKYGGVGIYDGGFRLPYYGVESDWLHIQLDHSRRLHHSELLPEEYRVRRGLFDLPTNSRILGTVRISTADERRWTARHEDLGERPLQIAITRDRLIDNDAFDVLWKTVRASMDFYAVREAARGLKDAEAKKKIDRAENIVKRVVEVVEAHTESLPREAVREIKQAVSEATTAIQIESEIKSKQANLLGALATAGMAATALEHESARQLKSLEELVARLHNLAERTGPAAKELHAAADDIQLWIEDTRAIRRLFTGITEPESREQRQRLRASAFLTQITEQLGPLMRGIQADLSGVPTDVRIPSGTFVEWSALFQNVFVNAVNATLDSDDRRIAVMSRNKGAARMILVQNTGVAVDLEDADELFEPFVRRLKLSPSRRGLGIGGSGLGLTITRMIAVNLGCRVSFVEPDSGFSTAFRLAWSERS